MSLRPLQTSRLFQVTGIRDSAGQTLRRDVEKLEGSSIVVSPPCFFIFLFVFLFTLWFPCAEPFALLSTLHPHTTTFLNQKYNESLMVIFLLMIHFQLLQIKFPVSAPIHWLVFMFGNVFHIMFSSSYCCLLLWIWKLPRCGLVKGIFHAWEATKPVRK